MQFVHVYSYDIGCVSLTFQVIRYHGDQARTDIGYENLTLTVIRSPWGSFKFTGGQMLTTPRDALLHVCLHERHLYVELCSVEAKS